MTNLLTNINPNNFKLSNWPANRNHTIGITDYEYGQCNCLTTLSCTKTALLTNPFTPTFVVDGLYTGCYMLEGILSSSMKCFYSQSCINRSIIAIVFDIQRRKLDPYPYALNMTSNSSYTINTTFFELINNLMIESWNPIINHQDYYQSCQPSYCTYSIVKRKDFISVITILFGIIGGLNKILRLLLPPCVILVIKFLNRIQIQPMTDH